MSTKVRPQLWRVEWVHRDGYLAPHQYVEAKTDEKGNPCYAAAHREAQKLGNRLMDFPKSWSFRLVLLADRVKLGEKWIVPRT